ncbi:phosphoserine phosphatase SerB [Govanella unica]|uniref:Phosphoserine phosphatase n=1 Tax=Govanella unica TaxID=2975056 RepID=A0A9X3Z6U8_9PROT|nr:phosphoserine phosphatase SerB [Govania unica]MDA5193487.1 phosphoserine phosphatase SerB [Govania unica]
MQNVLTLIANPQQANLTAAAVDEAVAGLKSQGAIVGPVDWLNPGIAADVPFDGAVDKAGFAGLPFDWALQPVAGRRKKLLLADMDSTIITVECIDEIADFAGFKEEVAGITEAAMRGELDFVAALEKRVGMLKGLKEETLQTVFDERVKLMPGARTLIQTMNAAGAMTALVSGGFTFFTSRVAALTGFHVNRANVLGLAEGALTGAVIPPIVDSATKLASLQEFAGQTGITLAETLAVGDGANDIPMIVAAGLGVAYHAKPKAQDAADVAINHGDLTALLYLQGFRATDFRD